MNFVLPFIGKTKSSYLEAGIQDYTNRLSRFGKVEIITQRDKSERKEPDDKTKLREAGQLLKTIEPLRKKVVVALDPGGKSVDSNTLADMLTAWQERGVETCCFVIGGHLGLHQHILNQADVVLSLSRLTFTHEMTRLIILEQLYRACTIQAGHKYHK